MLKKYQKFLEASIEDNPAVPGGYRRGIEREERQRLGVTQGDRSQEMQVGGQLMRDSQEARRLTSGKEEQLSELAKDVIVSIYGELLKRYHVDLDIKLVRPSEVANFMKQKNSEVESENSMDVQKYREITDEDLKNEIHKRKIANLIIQGKAKGIKEMLQSELLVNEVNEIFGEQANQILSIWRRLCDNADKLDWLADPQIRARMMEQDPSGFAGASFVEWKPKEKDETEEYSEEPDQEWTGEESEDDMFEQEMKSCPTTPVVKAVGIDFPMLLHETVKGIFELLSQPGLPEEESVAQTVLMNTGLSDEPEDWKYGPRIAKDLMSFLNQNPKIEDVPNLREEFFRTLLDRETMDTRSFLELVKGILENTPEARQKVDQMIDDLINDLDYDGQMKRYEEEMAEYERKMKEWEDSQKPESEKPSEVQMLQQKEKDPSQMSQNEIEALIDDAIDKGDYDTVDKLSKYLN
jgi:hypothetical protein